LARLVCLVLAKWLCCNFIVLSITKLSIKIVKLEEYLKNEKYIKDRVRREKLMHG